MQMAADEITQNFRIVKNYPNWYIFIWPEPHIKVIVKTNKLTKILQQLLEQLSPFLAIWVYYHYLSAGPFCCLIQV